MTKRRIILILVLLLACGISAQAAPLYNLNPTPCDNIQPNSTLHLQHDSVIPLCDDYVNSQFAMFGAELKKLPVFGNVESSAKIKSLPPVPQALFMALTGFLCISLIRDRKVWLTALAAVFYLGYAGINILPNIGSNQKTTHTKQSVLREARYFCRHGRYSNHPIKRDGTWYTGLLRHLAGIPASNWDLNSVSVLTSREFLGNFGFACIQASLHENSAFISREFLFPFLPHGPPLFV